MTRAVTHLRVIRVRDQIPPLEGQMMTRCLPPERRPIPLRAIFLGLMVAYVIALAVMR